MRVLWSCACSPSPLRDRLVDPRTPTPLSALAAIAVVGGFLAITAAGGETRDGDRARDGERDCEREHCLSGIRLPLLGSRRTQSHEVPDVVPEPTMEPTRAPAPDPVGQQGCQQAEALAGAQCGVHT